MAQITSPPMAKVFEMPILSAINPVPISPIMEENCPDVRNTRVIDIYNALQEYNVNVTVYDPWANPAVVKREYGIGIVSELPKGKFDAAIVAVAHKEFREQIVNIEDLLEENHVIFDVKCILHREKVDGRL